MRHHLFRIFSVLGTVLVTLPTAYAQAATTTTTIAVTANIQAGCTVSANPLPFGNYTSSTTSQVNTTITVTCTNLAPYNVGLDAGVGSGATVASRILSGPSSSTLAYQLYSNAAMTTIWGNTIGSNTVLGLGTGAAQTLTVYGKIASGQSGAPGAYNDTVTVTVTY